jgi:MoaD family protein
MAIKLEIPTALRPFTGKQASIEFEAATVGEALRRLTATYGDLQKHLYTEDGRIRSFVNIYVNDEDIRYLEKENTPIKDGDTISIVPSIAGGSQGPAGNAGRNL